MRQRLNKLHDPLLSKATEKAISVGDLRGRSKQEAIGSRGLREVNRLRTTLDAENVVWDSDFLRWWRGAVSKNNRQPGLVSIRREKEDQAGPHRIKSCHEK